MNSAKISLTEKQAYEKMFTMFQTNGLLRTLIRLIVQITEYKDYISQIAVIFELCACHSDGVRLLMPHLQHVFQIFEYFFEYFENPNIE